MFVCMGWFLKKYMRVGILSVLVFLGVVAVAGYAAHAERDDEGGGSDDTYSSSSSSSNSSSSASTPKMKAIQVTTMVPEPVTTVENVTVTKTDTDGDGLFDDEDPHPTIPEVLIVTDDNHNGIVDAFERRVAAQK